jgi:hypothetical protein
MVVVPRYEDDLIDRLYKGIQKEEQEKRGPWLGRMGASAIGEECNRKIFFDLRGYFLPEIHEGRILRLFETGHIQEARIIADFRRAGYAIWDRDPETGKQYTYLDDSGHFVVKPDAFIKGVDGAEKTVHAMEVKTHNDKNFKALLKSGVAKAMPHHYQQMQAAMWLPKVTRALYVALNKNDEQYYVEAAIEKIKDKISIQMEATLTPAGISETQSAWGCKFCPYKGGENGKPNVCAGEPAEWKNCRTCSRSQPIEGGEWLCSLLDLTLTQDMQQKGCEHYNPRSVYF